MWSHFYKQLSTRGQTYYIEDEWASICLYGHIQHIIFVCVIPSTLPWSLPVTNTHTHLTLPHFGHTHSTNTSILYLYVWFHPLPLPWSPKHCACMTKVEHPEGFFRTSVIVLFLWPSHNLLMQVVDISTTSSKFFKF